MNRWRVGQIIIGDRLACRRCGSTLRATAYLCGLCGAATEAGLRVEAVANVLGGETPEACAALVRGRSGR